MRVPRRRAIAHLATMALLALVRWSALATGSSRAADCADDPSALAGKARGFIYLDVEDQTDGRPPETPIPLCSGPSCSGAPTTPRPAVDAQGRRTLGLRLECLVAEPARSRLRVLPVVRASPDPPRAADLPSPAVIPRSVPPPIRRVTSSPDGSGEGRGGWCARTGPSLYPLHRRFEPFFRSENT